MKQKKVLIIGLGYVGLPIALLLAKKNVRVIGYDINNELVKKLKNGTYGTNFENEPEIPQK